nr:MAG TPA: Protein of unknown function (DUF722) [Caudoviricetes sp.]
MTKEILKQYTDLQQECVEVREKINTLEKQIARIEQDGSVRDKVSGGIGGWQSFTIEGFPYPEYNRKKALLYSRKATLCALEMEIMETINQIESFIATVEDSHMRRIIHLRFVDGLSWGDVAKRIGGNTEDSVKKMFYRFLEK